MDTDADHADDLLTLGQAGEVLGVDDAQATAMVEQGLLVPTEQAGGEQRFTRAAVEAVRLAGG